MFHQDSFMDSWRVPTLIIVVLLLAALFITPSKGQEPADTTGTPAESSVTDWGEGEIIELSEIRIEGEIALPNVVITVSRREPGFREITLERTPAEELTDFGFRAEDLDALKAIKVENWSEMLDKPRQ
jgi:hypothetical protein